MPAKAIFYTTSVVAQDGVEEGTELGQSRKGPVTAAEILTLIGDGEISAGVRPPSLELKS